MKPKIFRAVLLAALISMIFFTDMSMGSRNGTKIFTLPGLPRPIASAPIVITSAGQSTDTYIIRDISNQLMIRSFFMPQAEAAELEDIKSIVFVVGYSSLGMKLQNMSYEEENARIGKLLKEAEENGLTVLTVALGEDHSYDRKTEELLRLVGGSSDYLIGLRESNNESTLIELAKERDIPMTLVGGIREISGPFASAFR
ncbi:MAG TPA: DUF6305 family protein [Clostridia bacterium]|nr:DUF6305 family protein [Clostridia bacterium]